MRLWVMEAMQLINERPQEEIEFMYRILTMDENAKKAFLYAYELMKADQSIPREKQLQNSSHS
jgi:hypothetical protein